MNETTRQVSTSRLPEAPDAAYTESRDARSEPVRHPEAEPFAREADRYRDRLSRADRYVVTMLAALLGCTVLGFVAIGGQLLNLQNEIGSLRAHTQREIGDLRAEMHQEIGRLRTEMQEQFRILSERVTRVEERLTGVEERLTGVEERLTGAEERLSEVEGVLRIHHGPLPGS